MARSSSGPLFWPIDLYGDDGWSLRVEMTELVDGVETAMDVSARTYRGQVRAEAASTGDPLAEMDIDDSAAADGVIVVSIPVGLVRGLVGYWDLQEVIGSGAPTTLFAGPVTWSSDVTR